MNTLKTAQAAHKIEAAMGKDNVKAVGIEDAWTDDFKAFDNIIIGTSTWFDGELPTYWDEIKPEIESMNLKGKKIAVFGLGDQKKYPENFADGVGILAEAFENAGAEIVGMTPIKGYNFEQSQALRDGRFLGLVIDVENQSDLTVKRIESWVNQLKKEFK